MDNMEIWRKLSRPPKERLKQIRGGRLSGMTDVNPQWRYQAMTEQFGPVGVGWKYEIVRLWNEHASEGQLFAFAQINLYWSDSGGDEWSEAVPGIGGSMLLQTEKKGKPEEYLHANDEGYKMAVTDALSVAMKALGVAADIYAGLWDGSKYRDSPETQARTFQGHRPAYNRPPDNPEPTPALKKEIVEKGGTLGLDKDSTVALVNWYKSGEKLTMAEGIALLEDMATQYALYVDSIDGGVQT